MVFLRLLYQIDGNLYNSFFLLQVIVFIYSAKTPAMQNGGSKGVKQLKIPMIQLLISPQPHGMPHPDPE